MNEKVTAVSVLSGGMDSTVSTYRALELFSNISHLILVTFDYGQKHAKKEIAAAKEIAGILEDKADLATVEHHILDMSILQDHLNSALTDASRAVPTGHYTDPSMRQTVVPNRNMIMLSIAAGIAVARNARYLITGVHAGDHPIYPDCRPEFISNLEKTLKVGNAGFINEQFRVVTPFIFSFKADIVGEGWNLGVPFELTYSCYNGGETQCGVCATCVERRLAFLEANILYGAGRDRLEISDRTEYKAPLTSTEFIKGAGKEMIEKDLFRATAVSELMKEVPEYPQMVADVIDNA